MAPCSRCGFNPTRSLAIDSQNVDVLNLLRSGNTLSSTAASSIPDYVVVLEARCRAMQDDLACLEALVAQKRKEIAATRVQIEQTKSLAAPIRSIPREILLHIFSLVCVGSVDCLEPLGHPRSFGHVCKFWRTLSRSAPSLWSHISVMYPDADNADFSNDVLEQHLVLSSPRPLDIRLYFGPCAGDDGYPNTEAVIKALFRHSIRLRSLRINAGGFATKCFFSVLSRVDLRILKNLKLRLHTGFRRPSVKAYDIVFPPSLLSLDMDLAFNAFKSVTGEWRALASFRGPFGGPGSFYRFIAAADSLAHLSISCIGDEADGETGPVVVHENLIDLTLGRSCSMSLVLDKMSLPRLETLRITDSDGLHETCPRESRRDEDALLSRLLERSGCKLKTFIQGAISLEPRTQAAIWRMSTLISLQIDLDCPTYESNEISALLDSLTVTPSQQPLPGLRELAITCYLSADHLFTNSKFGDMIESRWNVPGDVSRLSKLTMVNCYGGRGEPRIAHDTSTLTLLLLELEDKGLNVSWEMDHGQDVLAEARKLREGYF
ncbi:hypothetical protein BDZ89DRAFT_1068289 [Hymenopellis radicata]|nr:hypothetical protein BDZ89DRAFT_1068289 [Hymenopellis radicata]